MKIAIIFVLFSLPLVGQEPTPPTPKISLADCTLVDHSPACKSFNEMVTGHDKDLVIFLGGDYITYVCFEKDEDNFMVISVSPAYGSFYRKEKPRGFESQRSVSSFQRFKNGESIDSAFLPGIWKRVGVSEFFVTDAGAQSVGVNDSEITYTDAYENLRKTKTEYSLSIRRSTLRFAENYRFPSEDAKAKTSIDGTGRCLLYGAKPRSF